MKAIVHIGYPKTGTSWLQTCIFPFVAGYKMVSRNQILTRLIRPEDHEFDAAEFVNHLSEQYGDKIIISHEDLLGNVVKWESRGRHAQQLAMRLHQSLPGSRIVIFIRYQIDLLASLYSEYVKSGGTYYPRQYFSTATTDARFKERSFNFELFDFHHTIHMYEELFGRENVSVFLYEDLIQYSERFIMYFLDRLSIELHSSVFSPRKVNARLNRYLLNCHRWANHFTRKNIPCKRYFLNIPKWYGFTRLVTEKLNNTKLFRKKPGSCELLGEPLVAQIARYYSSSNVRLAEEGYIPPGFEGYYITLHS